MNNVKTNYQRIEKRKVERRTKMDDKMKFLLNKVNLRRKRKMKTLKKNEKLQVELVKKSVLIIPRIYNLIYKK